MIAPLECSLVTYSYLLILLIAPFVEQIANLRETK
jgi:hypothetical protein